ncbi:MAG: lysophospholipid acyltransferase family protein [Myxococcaceae bacterium]
MPYPASALAKLTLAERVALRCGRFVNENPGPKAAAMWFTRLATSRYMTLVSGARMTLLGIEKMKALRPDRGVVLASNHRSFFDMYMVLTHLSKHADYCVRPYFPVRSTFFYEHPLGVLVNAAASSMAMFPPVYRDPEKAEATRAGLDFIAAELGRPGTVVGIHPEGTRGKGPDPYELLPAEPGFGRVVLQARPIVIPIFVNGLSSDFLKECGSTVVGIGIPIIIAFGAPVDLSEFDGADPHRLRPQVQVGRKVLAEIARLAEAEKVLRAELTAAGLRRRD